MTIKITITCGDVSAVAYCDLFKQFLVPGSAPLKRHRDAPPPRDFVYPGHCPWKPLASLVQEDGWPCMLLLLSIVSHCPGMLAWWNVRMSELGSLLF